MPRSANCIFLRFLNVILPQQHFWKLLHWAPKSIWKMDETHFPKHLKSCVWGNGRPQCCKMRHQSYVYGDSIPKQSLKKLVIQQCLSWRSCKGSELLYFIQWFSFPFLFLCIHISNVCKYMLMYVCRRLKKGSLKTQWVLYLLQNIHGKIFRLARMDCVALQLFLCVSLTVKMFFPNPVNPRHWCCPCQQKRQCLNEGRSCCAGSLHCMWNKLQLGVRQRRKVLLPHKSSRFVISECIAFFQQIFEALPKIWIPALDKTPALINNWQHNIAVVYELQNLRRKMHSG